MRIIHTCVCARMRACVRACVCALLLSMQLKVRCAYCMCIPLVCNIHAHYMCLCMYMHVYVYVYVYVSLLSMQLKVRMHHKRAPRRTLVLRSHPAPMPDHSPAHPVQDGHPVRNHGPAPPPSLAGWGSSMYSSRSGQACSNTVFAYKYS